MKLIIVQLVIIFFERLTYLQTGNELVSGSAINLLILIKFEEVNLRTDNADAKISENGI